RRVDLRRRRSHRLAIEEALIAALSEPVVLNPEWYLRTSLARCADGGPDLLVLPQHDPRSQIVQHKRELVSRLPPVGGTKHSANLRRREKRLEQSVAVLAEPKDPIPRADALCLQKIGQATHAIIGLGVAITCRAADPGNLLRIASSVLGQDVTQPEGVEQIDSLRRGLVVHG